MSGHLAVSPAATQNLVMKIVHAQCSRSPAEFLPVSRPLEVGGSILCKILL